MSNTVLSNSLSMKIPKSKMKNSYSSSNIKLKFGSTTTEYNLSKIVYRGNKRKSSSPQRIVYKSKSPVKKKPKVKVKVTLLSIDSNSKKPSLDLDNMDHFEVP